MKILLIIYSLLFIFVSSYSYPTPTIENTHNCFEPSIGSYGKLEGDGGQESNDLSVAIGNTFLYTINSFGNSCKNEHFYANYGQCISVEKPDGTIKRFIYNGSDGGHNKKDIHNILDSKNLYPYLTEIYENDVNFFDLSGEYKIRSSYVNGWKIKEKKKICSYYTLFKTKHKYAKAFNPDYEEVFATLIVRNLEDVLDRIYIPKDWESNSTIAYCNNINTKGLEPENFKILSQLSDLYKGCLIKNLDKNENNTILVGFKKSSYHDISNINKNEELSFLFSHLENIKLEEEDNIRNTKVSKNPFNEEETKVEYDGTLQNYINTYNKLFEKIKDFESNLTTISEEIVENKNIKNVYDPDGTLYKEFYIDQYLFLNASLNDFKDNFNITLEELLENKKKENYEEKYKHLETIKELNLNLFDSAFISYIEYMLNSNNNINNFTHYTLLFPINLEEKYKFYIEEYDKNIDVKEGLEIKIALNNFIEEIKNYIDNIEYLTNENKTSIKNDLSSYNANTDINKIEEYKDEEKKVIEYTNKLLGVYEIEVSISDIGSKSEELKIHHTLIIDEIYQTTFETISKMYSQTSSQTEIENSLDSLKKLISEEVNFDITDTLKNNLDSISTIIKSYEDSKESLNELYNFDDSVVILENLFENGILLIRDFIDKFDIPYYYECNENRGEESIDNCFYKIEKIYSNDRSKLSNVPLIFKFNDFIKKDKNEFRKSIYDNILTNNMIILNGSILEEISNSCKFKQENYILKAEQNCMSSKILEGDFLKTETIDGVNFKTYNILKKYPIDYYKKNFKINGISYSFEYDDVSTFFILKNFDNVDLFQKNDNNKLFKEHVPNKDSLKESRIAYISTNNPNENLNLTLKESFNENIEKVNIEINRNNNLFKISDCKMITGKDKDNINCGSSKVSYLNNENDFSNFFFNFMDVVLNLFTKD